MRNGLGTETHILIAPLPALSNSGAGFLLDFLLCSEEYLYSTLYGHKIIKDNFTRS